MGDFGPHRLERLLQDRDALGLTAAPPGTALAADLDGDGAEEIYVHEGPRAGVLKLRGD